MDSTLTKGLSVLEWMVTEQRPCGVSEVARAFGIARSNAHRTLNLPRLLRLGAQVEDAVE